MPKSYRRLLHSAMVALTIVAFIVGAPAAMAESASGGALAQTLEFAANYEGGFWVSPEPISASGDAYSVSQTAGAVIRADANGNGTYVDSGFVLSPEIPLGELDLVALSGDFANAGGSILNIWIDADNDGSIFSYDGDGKLAGLDGDAYGSSNTSAGDETLVVRENGSFYMMAGPTGNRTLAELKAAYPDSAFQLWIGVSDSTGQAPYLILDRVVINPDVLKVDPYIDPAAAVTDDGLIVGVEAFATIQAAVDAAADGTTIELADGAILSEQVVIDGKRLTLNGNGAKLAAVTNQVGPSVFVKNGADVAVQDFELDGQGIGTPGSDDNRFFGIYYKDSTGTISGNKITGFHHPEGQYGVQSGVAVYVKNTDGATRAVAIRDNVIDDYQKGGIVANGAGLSATISGNSVTGWGPVDVIAQNGIQIGFGATGVVTGNTIAGNTYTPDSWSASSILLYHPGSGVEVRDNAITSGYCGVSGAAVSAAQIVDNDFSGTTVAYVQGEADRLEDDFTNTLFRDNTLPTGDTTSPRVSFTGVNGTYWASEMVYGAFTGNASLPYQVTALSNGSPYMSVTLSDDDDDANHVPLIMPHASADVELRASGAFGTNIVETTIRGITSVLPNQLWVSPDFVGDKGSLTDDGKAIGYEAFSSIQSALGYAPAGGTVTLAAGETFREQLFISASLTLDGNGATLEALDGQTGPCIWAVGANDVTVRNLTIDGRGAATPGADDNRFFGVYFKDSSGTISGNRVIGIHHPDGKHGAQSGVGIYVKNVSGAPRAVLIEGNTVSDYQKGGIVTVGSGLTATIRDNTVTGWGPTSEIAQNGIQVSSSALGMIEGNVVSGNSYTGVDEACGILLYGPADGTIVSRNTVRDSEGAVYLYQLRDAIVRDNDLSGAGTGIWVWYSETGCTILDNKLPANDLNTPWIRLVGFQPGSYLSGSELQLAVDSGNTTTCDPVTGDLISDGEGKPYTIWLSNDDGATWTTIASDITGGSTTITMPTAAGNKYRLRVTGVVNDNTYGMTTPSFRVYRPALVDDTPVAPPIVAGSTSTPVATEGGTIGDGENLTVTFPSGALREELTVTLAPIVENAPPTEGMIAIGNHIYEITAETDAGESVTQFEAEITIQFTLSEQELQQVADSGDIPMVFYWDEELLAWIPVPTELVDGVLVARTDHLTTYAVMVKPGMPSLRDIKGHWAEKHILKMVGLGVIGGQPDGTFAPSADLTREQAAKMLALTLGLTPDANAALGFADAASISADLAGYVGAVTKAGCMDGMPGGLFDPLGTVTRAQFATMVARALGGGIEADGAVTVFSDAESIPSWARVAVAKAVKAGVISGQPGNIFAPAQACTRAEAAKMLSILIKTVR